MSDGKLSAEQEYNNLSREVEVIGKTHDFLYTGRFPGGAAQDLTMCQMYMKGLYNHMKAECDKRKPLTLPEADKAVETKAEALPVDSGAVVQS